MNPKEIKMAKMSRFDFLQILRKKGYFPATTSRTSTFAMAEQARILGNQALFWLVEESLGSDIGILVHDSDWKAKHPFLRYFYTPRRIFLGILQYDSKWIFKAEGERYLETAKRFVDEVSDVLKTEIPLILAKKEAAHERYPIENLM